MKEIAVKTGFFFVLLASISSVVESQSRIVGGDRVEPNDYPYFAYLSGCGGALIAPDIVLTAAHCGDKTGTQIAIGAYEKWNTAEGAQGRFCEEYISDPLFRTGDNYNDYDFALCKLDKPVDIDQSEIRLELNEDFSVPHDGDELNVMGFGSLNTFQDKPDFLQDVTVFAIDNDQCEDIWRNSYGAENMICAGYLGVGGKDSCSGDSGGPLVKRTVDSEGKIVDIHVALVSYGFPCAQAMAPTVYSRTSSRIDWIKDTSCNNLNSVASFCDDPAPSLSECDGEELTIQLGTDLWANETSWTLKDAEQEIVSSAKFFINGLEYEHNLCLQRDECYTWEIRDTARDGICYAPGGQCSPYTLTLNGNQIFSGDGNFGPSDSVAFCTTSQIFLDQPITEEASEGDILVNAILIDDLSSYEPSSESPTSCEDDKYFRWQDKRKKDCEKFLKSDKKRKIKMKCKKEWEGILIYDWCPKTCGAKTGEGRCA